MRLSSPWGSAPRGPLRAVLAAVLTFDLVDLVRRLHERAASPESAPDAPRLMLALGGAWLAPSLLAAVGAGAALRFARRPCALGAGAPSRVPWASARASSAQGPVVCVRRAGTSHAQPDDGCASSVRSSRVVVSSSERLSVSALAARSPGDAWDWHPARGRHPGEILYVTDGDDQRMRVKALSRATGGISEPMVGYAVAPTDAATFVLTDADPGWVHRHDGAGDARAVAVDAQADYLAASRDGARLAFVVADRASAPRLCVATVATARVECVAALKPHNVDPVFARDGRTLYYAAERGVRAIDLATGADRLVINAVASTGTYPRLLTASEVLGLRLVVSTTPGDTTVLHDLPAGETLGEPAVLPDGRVAYRAEIWLGELYQLDGAW